MALRKARVVIASKGDLVDLDIARVTKEPVTVIEPSAAKRSPAVRVRFRYVDQAVVPGSMVARNLVQIPLLQKEDESRAAEILADCTPEGTPTTRDPMKTLVEQYDPTVASCRAAMALEQTKIDAVRAALLDPRAEVVPEEVDRLYAPLVASLTSLDPNVAQQQVDPVYERVEPGSGTPENPSQPGGAAGPQGDPGQPGGAATGAPAPKPRGIVEGEAERRARAAATAAANVETIKPGAKPPPRPSTTEGEALDFSGLSDWNFLLVGVALLALFPLLRKSKT
jgi:hypothetical protein